MSISNDFDVVTGATGYTGRYIARALLSRGRRVKTLTGHLSRKDPFGDRIEFMPFNFDRPAELARSLEGARALFNTYWIRFPYGGHTFQEAIANTRIMLDAARSAGVRKFVHISVTKAAESSPLPYFRGKAMLEAVVRGSGLNYAIVRPALIFGVEDILLNNIAWLLRRFPLFAIPGHGDYRVQPIFAGDLGEIAASAADAERSAELDAIGPEIFTFEEVVRMLAGAIRCRARILHLDPRIAVACARIVGWFVGDVVLTRDEARGLMSNLLVTDSTPNAPTRFSQWLRDNANQVGVTYSSELARHFR
jgi:uncharacterized protein YbjT (DUF2867 family)